MLSPSQAYTILFWLTTAAYCQHLFLKPTPAEVPFDGSERLQIANLSYKNLGKSHGILDLMQVRDKLLILYVESKSGAAEK